VTSPDVCSSAINTVSAKTLSPSRRLPSRLRFCSVRRSRLLTDTHPLISTIRRAGRLRNGSVESVYQNLLAQSELLAACLEGHPVRSARVCDATCLPMMIPLGPDLIKVAFAIRFVHGSVVGTPLGVQKRLTRHTDIRTMMRDGTSAEGAVKTRMARAAAASNSMLSVPQPALMIQCRWGA
jgi:hypothetical protein